MSARSTEEWKGATPDTVIPPRVRLRVFDRANGCCTVCTRKIAAGDRWQADHVIALINGGANVESNLRLVCDWCHKAKTASDVAEKSRTAKVRMKHLGIRPKYRWAHGKDSNTKRKIDGTVVSRNG